ncbi:MAG: nucleoside triphosphate pyrophosphohydrolase [Dehalococcoidales bacterium]|nr:nucleoside triphosphate pyrophosphohydrolase [Dehalococcoidales bacterium]
MEESSSLPQDLSKFDSLVEIIARLRAPDGCPWDREQTHRSLRSHLLSECYEVLEALDGGDPDKLCEELGDLLLQIMLHAQIGRDGGEFEIRDVIRGIATKIVRRHPHVFGTEKAASAEEVTHIWEEQKKGEREEGASVLEGVPKDMPALARAYEISRRAVRVGFEWEDIEGVIDKLAEEVGEIKDTDTKEEKEKEFGDLLFTLVNVARWEGIDAEMALREANRKFCRRFTYMEELCRERGLNFSELSFEEKDALWEEAKREVD